MINYRIENTFRCNQDWDTMKSIEGGKYCSSCSKILVDFTQMTNEEIVNYLQNNSHACGRILTSQLYSPIYIHEPTQSNFFIKPNYQSIYLKKVLMTGLFFLSLHGLMSQTTPYKHTNKDLKTEVVKIKKDSSEVKVDTDTVKNDDSISCPKITINDSIVNIEDNNNIDNKRYTTIGRIILQPIYNRNSIVNDEPIQPAVIDRKLMMKIP